MDEERVPRWLRRSGGLVVRVLALVAIVGVVGAVLGWVVSTPLRVFKPEVSQAIRLDQARLAGNVLPDAALITPEDLDPPWEPVEELLQGSPIGAEVCGEPLAPDATLGRSMTARYRDTSVDAGGIVSEVQRFDRFNDAAGYVSSVASRAADCGNGTGVYYSNAFYTRAKVTISRSREDLLITDQVRLIITTENLNEGTTSTSVLGLMSVGDLVTGYTYAGPPPRDGFLPDLERKVLARLVPEKFGTSGVDGEQQLPDSVDTVPGQPEGSDEPEASAEG